MSETVVAGWFALGGVALGSGVTFLGERLRTRDQRNERLRADRQGAYAKFLAAALTTVEEATIHASSQRSWMSSGFGKVFHDAPQREELKQRALFTLGEASATLQILGSAEVYAASRPILVYVQETVVAADQARPLDSSFFEGRLREWAQLRARYLEAVRADIGLPQAEWPTGEHVPPQ